MKHDEFREDIAVEVEVSGRNDRRVERPNAFDQLKNLSDPVTDIDKKFSIR